MLQAANGKWKDFGKGSMIAKEEPMKAQAGSYYGHCPSGHSFCLSVLQTAFYNAEGRLVLKSKPGMSYGPN
jgi:hypothetical protein